jgi:hypothetical protein
MLFSPVFASSQPGVRLTSSVSPHNSASAPAKAPRINTCKTATKQKTSTPSGMNTCEKTPRGPIALDPQRQTSARAKCRGAAPWVSEGAGCNVETLRRRHVRRTCPLDRNHNGSIWHSCLLALAQLSYPGCSEPFRAAPSYRRACCAKSCRPRSLPRRR